MISIKQNYLKKEVFKILTETLYKTQKINKAEREKIYKTIK